MIVSEILESSVEKFSDKVFVTEGQRTLTFNELNEGSKQISKEIRNKYSRNLIGLLMDNSIEYLVSYFGIMRSNNIVVPVNTQSSVNELVSLVEQGVRVFFLLENNLKDISKLPKEILEKIDIFVINPLNTEGLQGLDSQIYSISIFDFEDDGEYEDLNISENDIALIIFTSGTKSAANGVCLTHKNLITNMDQIVNEINITDKDSMLVIIPFYYSYGNSLILTHLVKGAKLILNKNSILPMYIINDLKTNKCTSVAGVASNFIMLLKRSKFLSEELDNLRYITLAGEPVPDWILNKINEKGINIYVMYGQTEATARITILKPEDLQYKKGSVGKPLIGETIKIINSQGTEVPKGEHGEVIVSGPNVMKYYLNREKLSNEKLKNGFLYTGDFGKLDEDGYLYINGRLDEMIKIGGERVFPIEIEKVILSMTKVKEVGVVGIKNEKEDISSYLGQSIYAFIVAEEEITENEVINYCKENLPKHKVPEKIVFVKELTRTKTGKLRRNSLESLL